tara:strand:+ start:8406 stop:9311 length:906 start_codon:yes stop_codon:yes gene_type:complete
MAKFGKWIILFLTIGIVLLELILRFAFGFCDTVLIQEDKSFEYIAQPNQNRYRFGNHISYNSFSMRSPEVNEQNKIILGFGDSVLNGGVLTDQDVLATTILSKELSKFYNHNTQFLNISAGSWGLDNCYAYLQKFGNFDAEKIYLIVSSHDAYDNMDFRSIVGLNPSFPREQYKLAIFELLDRYLIPRLGLRLSKSEELGISKKKADSKFNSGFSSFYEYGRNNGIPIIIYLHADRNELDNDNYNSEGQKIIQFANQNKIPLIQDLHNGLLKSHFRDDIHLNKEGQKLIVQLIMEFESNKL